MIHLSERASLCGNPSDTGSDSWKKNLCALYSTSFIPSGHALRAPLRSGVFSVPTDYVYNKKEGFLKTKTHMAQPCIMVALGKSYRKASIEGK